MADDNVTAINTKFDPDPYDYDGVWKGFIKDFWREILKEFMPDLYDKADLNHEPEFLDKELRDILAGMDPNDNIPVRFVDTLMKVFLKDGHEEWVLLHIEVQGPGEENISRRMFRYYCLLFVHHDRNPAAMTILTAKRPKKEGDEPGIYSAEVFGTKIEYKYNVVKAYEFNDEALKASNSLVSLFIYALKVAAKNRHSDEAKFKYMREILRLLWIKGFDINIRRVFIVYLEKIFRLSGEEYKLRFENAIDRSFEGGKTMEYQTVADKVFERWQNKFREEGREEGREEERKKMIAAIKQKGFMNEEQIAEILSIANGYATAN